MSRLLAAALALFALVLAGFLADADARGEFPLDDAWIHGVYARSLSQGALFEYNEGQREAGATSPLWAIVSAPAHWLLPFGRFAVVGAVKAIGVVLALASLLLVHRIFGLVGAGPWVAGGALLALALDPRFAFSALSGMETSLFVTIALGATALALRERWVWASVVLGLLPVTRPEGVIALPAIAYFAWKAWKTSGLRGVAPVVIAPLLPSLAWVGFCLATTGHPLPTTFYLKAQARLEPLTVLSNVTEGLAFDALFDGWVLALALGAFVWMCLRSPSPARLVAGAALGLFPLAYVAAIAASREVHFTGYYWTRWLDPGAHLATIAAGAGLGWILSRARDSALPQARRRIATVAVLGAVLVSVPKAAVSFSSRSGHLASDGRSIRIMNVEPALWIAERARPGDALLVNDAGALRYLSGLRTIDLIGLNDAEIAFRTRPLVDIASEAQWIAAFPHVLTGAVRELAMREYAQRAMVTMPPEEYTVCDCPAQARLAILERRR